MLIKKYILLQYIFRIFIMLFILRQLLVVQWKQFFAIFSECRNQTYDLFPLRQRNAMLLHLVEMLLMHVNILLITYILSMYNINTI